MTSADWTKIAQDTRAQREREGLTGHWSDLKNPRFLHLMSLEFDARRQAALAQA